jgi:hypothetical protein
MTSTSNYFFKGIPISNIINTTGNPETGENTVTTSKYGGFPTMITSPYPKIHTPFDIHFIDNTLAQPSHFANTELSYDLSNHCKISEDAKRTYSNITSLDIKAEVPPGATHISGYMVGGGGGGGGAGGGGWTGGSSKEGGDGGSGGSGNYSGFVRYSISPNNKIEITVGEGGTFGIGGERSKHATGDGNDGKSGNSGFAGNASVINIDDITICTASGGNEGNFGASGNSGSVGGSGTDGTSPDGIVRAIIGTVVYTSDYPPQLTFGSGGGGGSGGNNSGTDGTKGGNGTIVIYFLYS